MNTLELPDVTLLAVSSVKIPETLQALKISIEQIRFASVKLISDVQPREMDFECELVQIPKIDIQGYNRFLFNDLHNHFSTTHCLIVQADGFVVNPGMWRSEFLDYDYIGAPWPEEIFITPEYYRMDLRKNRVGNGGFSLRSRRLAKLTSEIGFESLEFPIMSEDLVICHFLYEQMKNKGMVFPSLDMAGHFSVETRGMLSHCSLSESFGFHGKDMLPLVRMIVRDRNPIYFNGTETENDDAAILKYPRNALCPCGSNKKFKFCHGRLV